MLSVAGALMIMAAVVSADRARRMNKAAREQGWETRRRESFALTWMRFGNDGWWSIRRWLPGRAFRGRAGDGATIFRRALKTEKTLDESAGKLRAISRAALPKAEQLNYDLYAELLATAEEGTQYGDDPLRFRQVVPQNLWDAADADGRHPAGCGGISFFVPRSTFSGLPRRAPRG